MRWRVIARALFPRRIVRHKSNRADIGHLSFNDLLVRHRVRLGGAHLSVHHQRAHLGACDHFRSSLTIDAAGASRRG